MLLLIATFIVGYYQWNIFQSSDPFPITYYLALLFINATLVAIALITFNYVFKKI